MENDAAAAPEVSIVLLNFNGGRFIEACVDSVLAQNYPNLRFLIIDNASTDGSVDIIRRLRPEVEIIVNEQNLGYSRAHNQGMRLTAGKYVMPLNYDIILEPDYVSRLVRVLEDNPRAGSLTGKLLRFGDRGKTTIVDSKGHQVYSNRYVTNIGEDNEDTDRVEDITKVFGVCGAAPLYRREMLDDIAWEGEYLDESFFIMLEDVDIDWRANLRGWKALYVPEALAYHYRTASASQKSRLIQRHYYKNRYLSMWKNDTCGNLFLAWPHIFIMDIYLFLDILFTAPVAYVLACYDLVRLIPLTLNKRRAIQSRRVVDAREMRRWLLKYDWTQDIKRKLKVGR